MYMIQCRSWWHADIKTLSSPVTWPSLQMALTLHALLSHLGIELATLLTLARRSKVTREYGLGHQLRLLLLVVANGYARTGVQGLLCK